MSLWGWKIVVVSTLLEILVLAPMAQSSCFPAIFNFGDSTSDTGGIHASFPGSTPAEYLPYGETFFGRAGVRYSDGRLLIDFIGDGPLFSALLHHSLRPPPPCDMIATVEKVILLGRR